MKKIVIFIICSLIPFWSYAQNKVLSFRVSDKETHSRFVIDLKNKPKYKTVTSDNPPRIVIELNDTSWDDKIPPHSDNKLIKAVRYLPNTSPLKLVLDLSANAKISSFIIPPSDGKSYRLVLDLKPLQKAVVIPTPVTRKGKSLNAPIPRKKEQRKPLIVIDAGHGGDDPGTIGHRNTYEKDITLEYSIELKKQLEETGRYRVYMTRDRDVFIKLTDRVEKARKVQGDMFISIHANSHENKETKGLSVYTLSENASDTEAEALASKENKEGIINGVSLENEADEVTELLIDMTQRETKNLSASFAETIIAQAKTEIELLNNPHRFAGFRVLTGADIPSVLVELGYLTNPKEEKLLKSKKYKKKLASSIVEAIDEHFKVYKR
jgi:N-acetylmuramoyl-L-alanine amidase